MGGDPTCVMTGSEKSITLNCPEPVTISESESSPTDFWIVLPPVTFENGFTVTVKNSNDEMQTYEVTGSCIFARNKYYDLKREVVLGQTTDPSAEVPSNQIWYTSIDGEIVTPNRTNVFGANIISNVYENDKGVIIFDGDIISIGEFAFNDCSRLTSVTIPDRITSIGNYAFNNCSSLTNINIPDSVTWIGDYAFRDCESLTSFYGKFASADNRCLIIDGALHSVAHSGLTTYTIPDSVTEIGGYAFAYCSSLTSITIPDSVTSIGYATFIGCSSLTSINIGNGVTSIGDSAFNDCSRLTSINIPDSVTWIGDYAFSSCSSLTSITILDGVPSIGYATFVGCSSLTSITIPDSVTEIGWYAFANCCSLTSITIPNSVTEIGWGAFQNCSSLTSVYCKPATPPTGGNYMFPYGCTIYVPAASVDAYKSASYWSGYSSDIEGYDFGSTPGNGSVDFTIIGGGGNTTR